MDKNHLLRIGGRISRSSLPEEVKHPVIIPKNCRITESLIRHHHNLVHHQGRGITINHLRSSGFWIINAVSSVKKFISACVTCKKLRGKVHTQKMSDLPFDRTTIAPPFSYSACDVFGPFLIKIGRSNVKRWVLLFTCMQSRAVRLELCPSLSSSTFMNCLRRFICRNGPIRMLRCDQGTNFVGMANELKREYEEMNFQEIGNTLVTNYKCDFFPFKFNPPYSSHFGGIWERQIKSVRNVINALLLTNSKHLDDDLLLTFLAEAEATINSRPLTVENLGSANEMVPITPQMLITSKIDPILPPPGSFESADLYSRKRWRRVQHLAQEFWSRWTKEYLMTRQTRSKWQDHKKNIKIGDIVIIIENVEYRNSWILARIIEVTKSTDELVRSAKCQLAQSNLNKQGIPLRKPTIVERPINKMVLLCD